MEVAMDYDDLTGKIIKAAYKVYNVLGKGFLEKVYQNAMFIELKAVENLAKIHEVQLVNYLNAAKNDTGLLINFGDKIEVKRKFRNYNKE